MEALKVALDLLHMPSRVRLVRSGPLPQETLLLLQIAAGEEDAIQDAVAAMDRPRNVIEDAASFFIEQILFNPASDSYRVLGAGPQSTNLELRRNMALLLRWVHPDLDRYGSRASFATRVSRAWDDLKTAERRQAYDETLLKARPRSKRRSKSQALARRSAERPQRGRDALRRLFFFLFPKS
jgi:hypothetical protein